MRWGWTIPGRPGAEGTGFSGRGKVLLLGEIIPQGLKPDVLSIMCELACR